MIAYRSRQYNDKNCKSGTSSVFIFVNATGKSDEAEDDSRSPAAPSRVGEDARKKKKKKNWELEIGRNAGFISDER